MSTFRNPMQTVRLLTPFVIPDISLKLDRVVFGADRSGLLRSLAEGSLTGVSLEDGSFGLVREGERALYLGPLSAATSGSGTGIVETLVRQCPEDRVLYWDIPDQNRPASELAARLGFRPVRELTRMWLGKGPAPCDPAKIFALAEPGLG